MPSPPRAAPPPGSPSIEPKETSPKKPAVSVRAGVEAALLAEVAALAREAEPTEPPAPPEAPEATGELFPLHPTPYTPDPNPATIHLQP